MSIDLDTRSHFDVIIALPHYVIVYMLENHIFQLPPPGLYFPPIPPQIRRVWIYEDGEIEGITVMIRLRNTIPINFYALSNPLYIETMEAIYDYHRDMIPSAAPVRMLSRFRSRPLLQLW